MSKKNTATQTLKVQELTRNTAHGAFIYCIYKGKVVRRPARRGRPTYEPVAQIEIKPNEKTRFIDVPVMSQLGRVFLPTQSA